MGYDTDTISLLKLWLTPNLGPLTIKKLLKKINPITEVFKINYAQLVNDLKLKPAVAISIVNNDEKNLRKELALIKHHQVKLVSIVDDFYPQALKEIYAPPPILYYKGNLNFVQSRAVSIVGSRHSSVYGQRTTRQLVKELQQLDPKMCIISGLALGIDGCAHQSAINEKLQTIAVLGNGLASIYPYQHKALADQIINQGGAIVSDFSMLTKPLAANFPMRNRIISGLSHCTVVIEAHQKSGSLITAKYALEQGREVFVVPANLDNKTFAGSLNLIKNNVASILTSANDIIETLDSKFNLPATAKNDFTTNTNDDKYNEEEYIKIDTLSKIEQKIIKILVKENASIDGLTAILQIEASKIMPAMVGLELNNLVSCDQYGFYKLKSNLLIDNKDI